jgi:hypothetical protein
MDDIKEILITFAKGVAAAFFALYTSFVIYGTYKLGFAIMMPFIKIEAGFILVISLLVISHILGKYEKRLKDFANSGKLI